MTTIVPNFGQTKDYVRPVDSDLDYKDPPQALDVQILFTPSTVTPTDLKSAHCLWHVGTLDAESVYYRVLHVVREGQTPHLTNWGALTGIIGPRAIAGGQAAVVGRLELEGRRRLEGIAGGMDV